MLPEPSFSKCIQRTNLVGRGRAIYQSGVINRTMSMSHVGGRTSVNLIQTHVTQRLPLRPSTVFSEAILVGKLTQYISRFQIPQISCSFLRNTKALGETLTCGQGTGHSAHVARLPCVCKGQTEWPRLGRGLAHARASQNVIPCLLRR